MTMKSRRRVLVVDDNQDSVTTLSMLLKVKGHDAHVAENGEAAIRLADDYQPEVVLLDLSLPGMDGYEVARRLRQQPGLENAVLVAVSGWGQEEDRRRSLEAGFDGHMVKPAAPQTLREFFAHPKLAQQQR